MVGLFMNFCRLTDKALREYDAARAELLLFVSNRGPRINPYLRAVDHMENCVSAAHRAVLNAQALQANKIGRAAPQLTQMQQPRLTSLRVPVIPGWPTGGRTCSFACTSHPRCGARPRLTRRRQAARSRPVPRVHDGDHRPSRISATVPATRSVHPW